MTNDEILAHPQCIHDIRIYGNAFYSESFNGFYDPQAIVIKSIAGGDPKYYLDGREVADIQHIKLNKSSYLEGRHLY